MRTQRRFRSATVVLPRLPRLPRTNRAMTVDFVIGPTAICLAETDRKSAVAQHVRRPAPARPRSAIALLFHSAAIATVVTTLGLAGCRQAMTDQQRVDTWEASSMFEDGRGSRRPPPNTVVALPPAGPEGPPEPVAAAPMPESVAQDSAGRESPSGGLPPSLRGGEDLMALLRRGRSRFNIHCVPCHGLAGHGDGMVPRRGFPFPPSYHTPRLREKPLHYFFSVATRGKGQMPSYGNALSAEDRWAIAAYVRALQLSQHTPAHLLEALDRQQLPEEP